MTSDRNTGFGSRILLLCVVGIALLLPGAGCSSGPSGLHSLLGPFSADAAKDEAIRKRADADKFPTAQQAGIASSSVDK